MADQSRADGGLRELALFAGAGGGILAGALLGWRTVCAVECDPYAASVLLARQNDGVLAPCPIWDDVRTFDGRPWRGIVDVVSGGFPCQDISLAGCGAGIDGERSGLWREMARIVGEVRPRFVFVENSPALIARGLGRVLGDLAALGYDCRWTVLGAADVGAPHQRDRFWMVAADADRDGQLPGRRGGAGRAAEPAEPANDGREKRVAGVARTDADGGRFQVERQPQYGDEPGASGHQPDGLGTTGPRTRAPVASDGGERMVADADGNAWHPGRAGDAAQGAGRRDADRGRERACDMADASSQRLPAPEREALFEAWWWHEGGATAECGGWGVEPDVGRVADRMAARVDRLKAIGNGQVPQCAAAAWRLLTGTVP